MDVYTKLAQEQEAKRKEKEERLKSLERQLKVWQNRQKELRQIGVSAIDPEFLKRNLIKCSDEIDRITKIISTL